MNLLGSQTERKKTTKQLLSDAERQQARLRLHAQTQLEKYDYSPALSEFLAWVATILPADKFTRFKQMMRTPISTLEITNELFLEISRIFQGANPFFSYEFTDQNLSQDFADYLRTELHDKEFFATCGFEQLKTCINSVLIVDLEREQTESQPEPYYYFIQVNQIEELDVDDDGEIKAIAFCVDKKTYAVYDELSYKIYNVLDGNKTLVVNNAHDLGYCPAKFFWNKNLRKDNNIIKKSPITDVLSKLDMYLLFNTCLDYADMYTGFPIIAAYEQKCSFDGCNNGFIKTVYPIWTDGRNEMIERWDTKCPACSNRSDIGPGTLYEKPFPQKPTDPEIGSPIEFITASTDGLKYLKDKLNKYEEDIEDCVLGEYSDVTNQAINENQVFSSYERRKNVLINIKSSFEVIHKFANDTVARLRYGSHRFVSSIVFYGDEFFLKDVAQLMMEYENAKKNFEPDEEIDLIYRQIIQTKYKGNPDKIQRCFILLNLNPEPHKSIDQCQTLVKQQAMTMVDFVIKARFDTFIMKFEREQASLLEFGSNAAFDIKINAIREVLKTYANEEMAAAAVSDSGTQEAANNLRGLVGGVTGIIEINKAVAAGEMDIETASNVLVNMYNFPLDQAKQMITKKVLPIQE